MTTASSELQIHTAHLVLFGVWVLIFAVAYIRGRRQSTRRAPTLPTPQLPWRARIRGWTGAIAACSIIAAGVHLDVIGEHFRESAWYGSFFLGLTITQLTFAACVVIRPSRALIKAGALASLGVILLWAATRTTGIPLGPAAGQTEPIGVLDVAATLAELATIITCVAALKPQSSVRQLRARRSCASKLRHQHWADSCPEVQPHSAATP
jgi:hypothetical protein